MSDVPLTDLIDPANNLSDEDWLERMEDVTDDLGFFEPLGPDHSALFVDKSRQLLVTFEVVQSARNRSDNDVPLGWEMAERHGWSQLCILAHSETWFRHRAVYMFFDRLIDDGFFDEYDRIVFHGSGSCGYAAAAYSVAAPGATVIALQPQATLDPRVTEWDSRFDHMRRVSFTDRYGYAPDMLDAAERAFVLYDPEETADAMHAALFTRQNVMKLRCRYLDGEIEAFLRRMQILQPLLVKAMDGSLTEADFYRLFRERRTYLPYLRRLLSAVDDMQRPYLTGLLCRSVLVGMNTPRFRRQLDRAEHELAEQGRALPAQRSLQTA
ncbi:MAG: phosphoadenosine phosphosulfate reductase [Paracoccaceae bacterium]